MITEGRAVTILALASVILVGFLLFSGGDEPTGAGSALTQAGSTTTPGAAPTPPTDAEQDTSAAEPVGAGRCPRGYRVKGATSEAGEKRFHRPGGATYGSTKAEQCFASAFDAETAGFLAA